MIEISATKTKNIEVCNSSSFDEPRVAFFLLFPLLVLIFLALTYSPAAAYDTKTRRISMKAGETVELQIMYFIVSQNCKSDKIPPRPVVMKPPKLGSLSFRSGKATPHQCPTITINANFADYHAGNKPGTDRFKIHWPRHGGGGTFYRNYVVTVTN